MDKESYIPMDEEKKEPQDLQAMHEERVEKAIEEARKARALREMQTEK